MSERTERQSMFEHVDGLFGEGLGEQGRTMVEQRVGEHFEAIVAMRAVPLSNADEPFIVFAPHDALGQP